MKKVLLVAVLAVFSLTANAQDSNFSVGANLGFPIGDSGDFYSFSFGADVNYMFTSGEDFNYGVASGFQLFTGKTIGTAKVSSVSFLPIAGVGRFNASDKFVVGADLGYAIGLSPSGNSGGFYYKPMVGYALSDTMELNAFYAGVSRSGGSMSRLGVGIMFKL